MRVAISALVTQRSGRQAPTPLTTETKCSRSSDSFMIQQSAWARAFVASLPYPLPNFIEKLLTNHIVADLDRPRVRPPVCAPPWLLMTIPSSPRNTAADARRPASRRKALATPSARTDSRCAPTGSPPIDVAQILRDLARGALRRLERDVARKALGHEHVHRAAPEIVALDEAVVGHVGPFGLAQNPPRGLHLLQPLDLLDADIDAGRRSASRCRKRSAPWPRPSPPCRRDDASPRRSRRRRPAPAIRRAASATTRSAPGARSTAAYAGKSSPSPSARRYCPPRPRNRPRRA